MSSEAEDHRVGGRVVEVRPMGDVTLVWAVNSFHGIEDEVAVMVRPAPAMPEVGDAVWWAGRTAFWAPRSGCSAGGEREHVGWAFDPRPETGGTP